MKIQWERSRNSDLSPCHFHNNYMKANKQPSIQRAQIILGSSLNEKQNIPQNILGTHNIQLFSKLKQSQQQKMSGYQKMVNYRGVAVKQLQFANKNNRKLKKVQAQRKQWSSIIPVSLEQKQKIQKLKHMKAKIVANRCRQSGKSIQQVMKQQVMPYLDWQIHNILIGQQQRAGCLDNIIEELSNIQNRKFKNLESTAEYYESPNHNNQQTYSINIKQPQHNSSAADQITQLSTIKYLSSPQLSEICQEVQTFNRNDDECAHLQKSNNQDLKIIQFTLGNLCQDQHTEHAQFADPICQIQGKIIKQADIAQIGSKAAKTVKQFVDDSFGIHTHITSPSQSKNNGEKAQNGQLFFSRKKVPKGKVIKIRVMGHCDNDNLTAE